MDDRIERSFELQAPIDVAFAFLADPTNMDLFRGQGKIPGVLKQAPIPRFEGQIEVLRSVDGGEHMLEVLEFKPPTLMKFHTHSIGFPVSLFIHEVFDTWTLTAIEGGTHVHRVMEIHYRKNAISEMLGRRLLTGNMAKSIETHHERIREKLDAGRGA